MRTLILRCAALLLVLIASPVPAGAESAAVGRPSFQNLRFQEDWSALRGLAAVEFLDPIKYIALDDAGEFWLSLGGQLRGRVEMWSHFRYGGSTPDDDDVFFLSRIRFHADLHLTKYLRLFAEFKSALSTDRSLAGGRRTADVDTADLQNVFGELMLPLENLDLGVFGGRRELQFGAQRLVSPLDWANSRRTFNTAAVYARGDVWEATGFWSQPVIVDKYHFNDGDEAQDFYGIYSSFEMPFVDQLSMDLYWLGISFDGSRVTNGTAGPGDRHTVGGRLFGDLPCTPLVLDMEGAVQFGEVGDNELLAGMFSAMFTWPFTEVAFSPALFLGYDWASGDSGSGGKVGTFDQLFPLGHAWLGFIDSIARQNMQAIQGGVKFSPLEGSVLTMNWLAFWLDDVNDALYEASGAIVRLDPTASSNYVGTEVDVTFTYTLASGLGALFGYSHFFAGEYLSDTGPDEDIDFGYMQLTYTF